MEAQAPSTTVIARLFGQELPDGQVRGRGRLSQKEGRVALSAIDLTSGPPVEQAHQGGLRRPAPTIRLTGAIGDLLAFRQVDVRSDFRLPTRSLLAKVDLEPKAELGRVHGDLHLSDADGTMGFDHLTADLRGTDLLRVKVDGLIGDFGRLDEVQLQTRLEVPSPPALAEVLGVGSPGSRRSSSRASSWATVAASRRTARPGSAGPRSQASSRATSAGHGQPSRASSIRPECTWRISA